VNDQVGYVFMVYEYAVTVDGGRSWSTWYAVKDLPDWRHSRPAIQEVTVEQNGSGSMKLSLVASPSEGTVLLQTTDFGQHWAVN
jgi:hypothetical protein